MTALAEAIAAKGNLIGTLVTVPSPVLAEALSQSGLDWLFFDLEHSVMTLAEVQIMIQAMRGECLSLVRIEEPAAVYVKKASDTGCDGIIVPQVNSPELARTIVAAGKFPPLGMRSVGLGRALGHGLSLAEGVATENTRSALIVQIEHVEGLAHVEEIAAIDGVDGLFIGPYDLSASMGIAGQVGDPLVQAAIERIVEAGKSAGKPVGIFTAGAEIARQALARGAGFVAVGADVLRLVAATRAMLAEVRR